MLRVGVDTGGTFTDFVVVSDGRLRTWKEPSTPDDPSRAILRGLVRILHEAGGAGGTLEIVHGSTVATNALLEGRTDPIAFVTNRGFEDMLEIGRQARPDLYNLMALRPEPLAPRAARHGIAGRLGPGGVELEPLDAAELETLAAALKASGTDSVALCLLHAYANPAHEDRVADALSRAGLMVSVSSRLVSEYREYERAATTAVNAAVAPIMSRYLGRLAHGLEQEAGRTQRLRLMVMASNGGALSAQAAGREAVRTVLSGPAGGVRAAMHAGSEVGDAQIISFDMGGTSTDVSLLPGRAISTSEAAVAGHPIRVPALDIHTVGAGGGSIGWRDPGGALRVGPMSAGADPGPACYGKGGPATVTDANLVLGRLSAERFLDGRMQLTPRASFEALGTLARGLGLTIEQTAEGMLEVAEATMARAIRVISLFRGHEPADFTLMAFGGAGGLHAASLAASLGMRQVVVPAHPGVFSAFGMTVADITRDASTTVLRDARDELPASAASRFALMEDDLRRLLASDGVPPERILFERSADLRYTGQSFELNVPVLDPEGVAGWVESFHAAHASRYGYQRPGEKVELVALRSRGIGPVGPPPREPIDAEGRTLASSLEGRRPISWRGGWVDAAVHHRDRLPPQEAGRHAALLAGPALIEESGATTFVPPGWTARLDQAGHLHLGREAAP